MAWNVFSLIPRFTLTHRTIFWVLRKWNYFKFSDICSTLPVVYIGESEWAVVHFNRTRRTEMLCWRSKDGSVFFLCCRTPQIYNLTAAHLHLALQAKPPTGQMRSMENEMLLKWQTSRLIQTVRFSSHLRCLYLWLGQTFTTCSYAFLSFVGFKKRYKSLY